MSENINDNPSDSMIKYIETMAFIDHHKICIQNSWLRLLLCSLLRKHIFYLSNKIHSIFLFYSKTNLK